MTEDEMIGWHHWLNGHEFEQILGDGERQESLECCIPWGCKELGMPKLLNNNKFNKISKNFLNCHFIRLELNFSACVCVCTSSTLWNTNEKQRAEIHVNISIMYSPSMVSQCPGWMEASFQQDKTCRRMVGSYSTGYTDLKIPYAWLKRWEYQTTFLAS